jgi:hypothetical protein
MRQAVKPLRTNFWAQLYTIVRPVLPAFVISRSVVLVVALVLEWLLDTGRIVRYAYIGNAPLAPLSATFDANWFSSIATGWYNVGGDLTQQNNIHFMPLYPILMRFAGTVLGLGQVSGGYNLAGVVVSHVFFFIAVLLMYKLTLEVWGDEQLAKHSVWLLCALPWAYVFSMAYSESLFLALSLGAILVAYRSRSGSPAGPIMYAGLLAALATLTRHQGIFIAACLVWLVAITPGQLSLVKRIRNALLSGAPAVLGFAAYVLYIGLQTGKLLAVFGATDAWGKGYLGDLPRILILPPANPAWLMDCLEFIGFVVWIALTIAAIVMFISAYKQRNLPANQLLSLWPGAWSFVGYAVVSIMLLLVIHTANQSWGRYMIVVFPCIWALARGLRGPNVIRKYMPGMLALQVLFFAAAIIEQVTP